jgi:ubiquinone/menaquinone biosynthesis C-methylase UbiE
MKLDLLTKKDLEPLLIARPDQRDYTLKRYFTLFQKIPYLARFKMAVRIMGREKFNNFLDIGVGSGIFIPDLAKRTNNFYGIDIHPEIKLVKEIIRVKKIPAQIIEADIFKLPFPDNYFDGILCLSVLEFISDINQAIAEIKRVCKTDGTIIIGAPIVNPLTNFIYNNIIKFKSHSKLHQSDDKKIMEEIKKQLKIEKLIYYPSFFPANFSLFFLAKAKKST